MSFRKDPYTITSTVGGRDITIETGRVATQAHGSVTVRCGDTVVLVTVCSQALDSDKGFFPLTVEYGERMYAAGRIPGSFFRREIGRPSEHETLVSRLIDRPIRPLFPKGLLEEVQVLASVISSDGENDADVLAVTGASAAVLLSPLPFAGPIAGGRIGRINGSFVLNPSVTEREQSDLSIVFAASADALVMVEGEAKFVSEDVIIEALDWGRKEIQPLIEAQTRLQQLAGKPKKNFTPPEDDHDLLAKVELLAKEYCLDEAMRIPDKLPRKEARQNVRDQILAKLKDDPLYTDNTSLAAHIDEMVGHLEKEIMRRRIIDEGTRIDGRDTKTVRPIAIETSVLPRTHGSALFTRGETQSLCITTLGSSTDNQKMDSLTGDVTKNFMLHYNFPPFAVGEVKSVRISRREIGHGALAEKALKPILPSIETFPFTLRVVAETLESNGSSSMAAVCGGCLSLMDAGVPISAPVAGVAMGLIKEGDQFIVLTDILGDEDALGDMDFKIAGTADGVTAVQMDIKITGLTTEIMQTAMRQAKEGRLHILGEMAKALPQPRPELSQYAPQHEDIIVNPEVIRMIIGPGGKNIKAITTTTGASVDIDDSGHISIFAPTSKALADAKTMLQAYDQHPEVGKNYLGKIKKLLDIGVIVEILSNVEALVHISQLTTGRVVKVSDVAKIGDQIEVKVIEITGDRIRASRKAVILEQQGIEWKAEDTARPSQHRSSRPPRTTDFRGDDRRRDPASGDRRRSRPPHDPRRD